MMNYSLKCDLCKRVEICKRNKNNSKGCRFYERNEEKYKKYKELEEQRRIEYAKNPKVIKFLDDLSKMIDGEY